jgi:hypothetical protein
MTFSALCRFLCHFFNLCFCLSASQILYMPACRLLLADEAGSESLAALLRSYVARATQGAAASALAPESSDTRTLVRMLIKYEPESLESLAHSWKSVLYETFSGLMGGSPQRAEPGAFALKVWHSCPPSFRCSWLLTLCSWPRY